MLHALLLVMAVGSTEPSFNRRPSPIPQGGSDPSGVLMTGAFVGTCGDGGLILDVGGVQGCIRTIDVAPQTLRFTSESPWAGATVNISGATNIVQGGIGVRTIAMTAASCSGKTIDIIVNAVDVTGTEGVDFHCSSTNAACATSVAAWADALTGITATANSPTSGTVYLKESKTELTASTSIYRLDLSTNATACASIVMGADGTVSLAGGTVSVSGEGYWDLTGQKFEFISFFPTVTMRDGATIATWAVNEFIAQTINGISGGGTETVTNAATVYITGAPSGSNVTFTNTSAALWVGSGKTRLDGSLSVGGGTTILKHLSGTASLDFGVIAGGACAGLTIGVSGAADADTTSLGIPNALATTTAMVFDGWVSSSGNVTVRACCTLLAGNCADPAAATVRADVWQH